MQPRRVMSTQSSVWPNNSQSSAAPLVWLIVAQRSDETSVAGRAATVAQAKCADADSDAVSDAATAAGCGLCAIGCAARRSATRSVYDRWHSPGSRQTAQRCGGRQGQRRAIERRIVARSLAHRSSSLIGTPTLVRPSVRTAMPLLRHCSADGRGSFLAQVSSPLWGCERATRLLDIHQPARRTKERENGERDAWLTSHVQHHQSDSCITCHRSDRLPCAIRSRRRPGQRAHGMAVWTHARLSIALSSNRIATLTRTLHSNSLHPISTHTQRE